MENKKIAHELTKVAKELVSEHIASVGKFAEFYDYEGLSGYIMRDVQKVKGQYNLNAEVGGLMEDAKKISEELSIESSLATSVFFNFTGKEHGVPVIITGFYKFNGVSKQDFYATAAKYGYQK